MICTCPTVLTLAWASGRALMSNPVESSTAPQLCYVAKCNLGKVLQQPLDAGSSLAILAVRWGTLRRLYAVGHYRWPHKARGGPRTRAGAFHDLYTQYAARYHSQAHFASTFARKLCNFCPAHPPSCESKSLVVVCPGGWWPLQGYHGYLLPCCASPSSTNLEAPTPKLIYC